MDIAIKYEMIITLDRQYFSLRISKSATTISDTTKDPINGMCVGIKTL